MLLKNNGPLLGYLVKHGLVGHFSKQAGGGWSQAPRPRRMAMVTPQLARAAGCTEFELRVLAARKLPASIFRDGLALFKGCTQLARVVARIALPREVPVVRKLLSLELRASISDPTLGEIEGEVSSV